MTVPRRQGKGEGPFGEDGVFAIEDGSAEVAVEESKERFGLDVVGDRYAYGIFGQELLLCLLDGIFGYGGGQIEPGEQKVGG